MQMRPNLNFAGYATDVPSHYRLALGGELEIVRFAGSPMANLVPPDWGEKIVHGRLRSPFGDIDQEDRGAEVFAKLAEGGAVLPPFEETFFARRFGRTTDKYGVRSMVSVAPVASVSA